MSQYQTAELHFIDGPLALTCKIESMESLRSNRTYRVLIPSLAFPRQINLDNTISIKASEYHYIAIPLPENRMIGRHRYAMLLENGI